MDLDDAILKVLKSYFVSDKMSFTYIDWDYTNNHKFLDVIYIRYDGINSHNCLIYVEIEKFNKFSNDFYKNYIESKLGINKYSL